MHAKAKEIKEGKEYITASEGRTWVASQAAPLFNVVGSTRRPDQGIYVGSVKRMSSME